MWYPFDLGGHQHQPRQRDKSCPDKIICPAHTLEIILTEIRLLSYFTLYLQQFSPLFCHFYFAVAAKHKETKQFYTLYNTLDDKKLYLSKELTLLNSILDNYTE